MKRYNILKSLFALLFGIMLLTSCQEDIVKVDELLEQSNGNKVSTAAPTITGVYDYTEFMASETPTPCIEAQMGQDLVIVGENLAGLSELTIKGLDIESTDYYAVWNMVIMRVPFKLPTKDAISKIVCSTTLGSAEYSIDLSIPNIVISNIANEFQKPGEATYINGEFLSLCEFESGVSKIYIENSNLTYKKEVEIVVVTDESVTINIPSDAPDNSYFVFEINGETLTQKFHYRPTNLLMFDGTNPEYTGNWTDYRYTDGTLDGDIENLITDPIGESSELVKYIRIFGDIPKYKFVFGVNYNINFEIEDGKSAADYYLVYEINTQEGHPIPLGNTYKLMVNNKPVSMWENYSKVEIDTQGEWVTQRVSFTEVAKYLIGGESLERFDIKNMTALTDADHSFANFRIEQIIK